VKVLLSCMCCYYITHMILRDLSSVYRSRVEMVINIYIEMIIKRVIIK